MKRKKQYLEELKNKTNEELEESKFQLKKELFFLKTEKFESNKAPKVHLFSEKRRSIARILTIKNQRKVTKENS